uniref:Metaxin n=1 Tax=Panagrellus redivivus TaxID=6233 RepID=A0A7E4W2J1_PANRE
MSNDNRDDIELVVWPGDFGLLSIDTTCLQAMVAAKIAAAPVRFKFSTNSKESPSGELPALFHGRDVCTTFEEIADHLRNTKGDLQDVVLDGDLTQVQRSDFLSYASYLRTQLYPALLQTMWVDNSNYSTVTQYWFTSKMSFPWNMWYVESRRQFAKDYLATIDRTEGDILKDALKVLNNLSAKLGDSKYFTGDKPCSLDALIFGYLAPLLKFPFPNDRIQIHLASLPNLARFVESVICIYLPLTDEEIRYQNVTKSFWETRKKKAQKVSEEIRQRQAANEAESESAGSTSLRDTIMFGVGAVTLSVLFAVHTGIISFIQDDDTGIDDY